MEITSFFPSGMPDAQETAATVVDVSPWSRAENSYERILFPFHVSLRLFGLLYEPSDPDRKRSVNVGRWYHWLVVVVLWANFFRYFGAYTFGESFGMTLTTKLVAHALLFWGASGSTAGGMMTRQRPAIFRKWREYGARYDAGAGDRFRARARRRVTLTTCTCWLASVAHCGTMVYVNFEPNLRYYIRILLLPFVDPCAEWRPLYAILVPVILGLNLFNSTVCVFQLGYLLLLTLGVSDEFTHYNDDFRKHIKSDPDGFSIDRADSLEYWRQRHLDLCRLAGSVDVGFELYILLVFVTNIPICSLLVFRIIFAMLHLSDSESFVPGLILLVSNLGLSAGILLVITYIGTRLNSEATACKCYLYGLKLTGEQWTTERSLQYMTFYNKLTEGHVGITGWKLFYINKLTTKTVILMIVSYSFILLKFGLSESHSPFHCPEGSDKEEIFFTTTGSW